jgi:acyl carrier protein
MPIMNPTLPMPVMNPTLTRVVVIVSAETDADIRRIKHATTWNEIDADSLSRAAIFTACEREFLCELSDSKCEVLNTVGELADLIDTTKARSAA